MPFSWSALQKITEKLDLHFTKVLIHSIQIMLYPLRFFQSQKLIWTSPSILSEILLRNCLLCHGPWFHGSLAMHAATVQKLLRQRLFWTGLWNSPIILRSFIAMLFNLFLMHGLEAYVSSREDIKLLYTWLLLSILFLLSLQGHAMVYVLGKVFVLFIFLFSST